MTPRFSISHCCQPGSLTAISVRRPSALSSPRKPKLLAVTCSQTARATRPSSSSVSQVEGGLQDAVDAFLERPLPAGVFFGLLAPVTSVKITATRSCPGLYSDISYQRRVSAHEARSGPAGLSAPPDR